MASNDETDCQAAQNDLFVFDLACLGPALAIILVLASLEKRTKFKLELFGGHPGLLIPVNFLGGLSNRYTIAATFGATASKCATLFFSTAFGITIYELGGPDWLKIFQKLLVVLVYGIVFYPYFACLSTEYKLIGSVLGLLYGSLRFFFELSTMIRCRDSDVSPISFVKELPTMSCVVFIVSRFAILVFLEVRRKWHQLSREPEGSQAVIYKPLAGEADVVHVKTLLGEGASIDQEESRRWYKRLQHFIYKPRPDFKFSTQLISTLVVTSILIFQFVTVFLAVFEMEKKIYLARYSNILCQFIADVYAGLQGSFVVSAMISFTMLLHFVKCHRDHFLQLCRGQRNFAQSVSVSPAKLVGKGLRFSGYQIAYAIWGFLLLGMLFSVVSLLALLIKYQKEPQIRDYLGIDLIEMAKSTATSLIPVMVMSLMLWMFQYFLANVVFRDREFPNISVSIDNRRLHSIMSYFFFFFNILMGLFSCLGRIIKGLVLGIIFVSRIDRTSLMLGFQQWDKGFVAYLGFLHVLMAHRHPVMLVFCELLNTRERNPESGQSLELRASNTSKEQGNIHEKKHRMATAYPREIRHPRFSQKAVNRWLLAITLLRNPSLLQHRRQWYSNPIGMCEADTASITVLVQ